MCSIKTYLISALLVASSLAEQSETQSQWVPYPMAFQEFNGQQDQQVQASDYSGGYDFGSQSNSLGGHDSGYGGHDSSGFGGHDLGGHNFQPQSFAVHQHVEEENPEPVKHYKEVVVPIPKNVEFKVHQPIIIPVPQPIPIQVPVPKAVVIPVVKEISIPVEKSVPYPVEKHVHVPKVKEVPFKVIKHIIVPVEKPVPFKVPVYETIIHTKKGSHKI